MKVTAKIKMATYIHRAKQSKTTRLFVASVLYKNGLVIAMYLSKAITTTFMNDSTRNENQVASKIMFPILPSGQSVSRKQNRTIDKGNVETEYKISPHAMLIIKTFELVRNREVLSIARITRMLPKTVRNTRKARKMKPINFDPSKLRVK